MSLLVLDHYRVVMNDAATPTSVTDGRGVTAGPVETAQEIWVVTNVEPDTIGTAPVWKIAATT